MSHIVIIYSSKYGSAEDCAKSLKSGLPGSVSLVDINKTNSAVALESFDTVIFGSSIYYGKISKKMRTFCCGNVTALLQKRVGIFLCCALPEGMSKYLSENFPEELLKNATIIKDFGGEARMDKMKFVDKMIVKAATKRNYKDLKISHENIEFFIREIGK